MKPAFEGIDAVYKSKADNKDIRDLLEKLVPKAASQMVEFSKQFKGNTDFETCRNIFNYLKNNFTYLADGEEQIIKLPSALLSKKIGDCKSYSLFTAAILENLNIPYSFVYASYNSNPIPQHVYVVTGNGCIIDAVYGKFNQEKKPTYKYKKNMNVRYMAGLGDCGCKTCNDQRMGFTIISKDKRQAAADALKKGASNIQDAAKDAARKAEEAAKRLRDQAAEAARKAAEAAKDAADKLKQGAKTVTLAPARNLFLLIIKTNLDGFASKLSTTNTTNLMNQWYTLGGDRTILGNAIKTGASKPAKKFGFLPKLKKAIGNTKITGIGAIEIPEIVKTKIISGCTAAGTALGGTPQGTSAGAMLGGVVVSLLPTIYDAIMKVPATDVANADAPFTPPDEAKEGFEKDVNEPTPKPAPTKGNNTMLYVGGAALLAAGVYFATKKK